MNFSWDVSEELSIGLKDALTRQANIFVNNQTADAMPLTINVRQPDMQELKNLGPSEFVILTELIDHQKIPYKRGQIKPEELFTK